MWTGLGGGERSSACGQTSTLEGRVGTAHGRQGQVGAGAGQSGLILPEFCGIRERIGLQGKQEDFPLSRGYEYAGWLLQFFQKRNRP